MQHHPEALLFPNLVAAAFDPLPRRFTQGQAIAIAGRGILANVKTVSLFHSTLSPYDKPPLFASLGMQRVRELHLWHLAGNEISSRTDVDIDGYLGEQTELSLIHLHLDQHFRYAIGIDEQEPGTGTSPDDSTISTGGFEADLYIKEYGDAVARIVCTFAYPPVSEDSRHTASARCPKLRRIIIEVGRSNNASSQMVGRRIRKRIAAQKLQHIQAYGQMQEQGRPEITIRMCGQGTDQYRQYVLNGSAADGAGAQQRPLDMWMEAPRI